LGIPRAHLKGTLHQKPRIKKTFFSEKHLFEKNAKLFGKFQAIFKRRNFVLAGSHLSSIAGLCLLTATSAVPQLAHGEAKYFKGGKLAFEGEQDILNNNSENFKGGGGAIKIADRCA